MGQAAADTARSAAEALTAHHSVVDQAEVGPRMEARHQCRELEILVVPAAAAAAVEEQETQMVQEVPLKVKVQADY